MRPRQTFRPLVYRDWLPLFQAMSEHDRSELLLAIAAFPDYEPENVALWPFFQEQLEKQRSTYQEKCDKNQRIADERERKRVEKNERTRTCTNVDDGARTCTTEHERTPNLEPITYNLEPRDIKETEKEKSASRKSDGFRVSVFPKIAEAYNSILGGKLPQIRVSTDRRVSRCRAWAKRLYKDTNCQNTDDLLSQTEKFFKKVLGSPFLLGESDGKWKADFDFLISDKGYVGILEGKYDNNQAQQPARPFYTPTHDWESERKEALARMKEDMAHADAVNAYLAGGKA